MDLLIDDSLWYEIMLRGGDNSSLVWFIDHHLPAMIIMEVGYWD